MGYFPRGHLGIFDARVITAAKNLALPVSRLIAGRSLARSNVGRVGNLSKFWIDGGAVLSGDILRSRAGRDSASLRLLATAAFGLVSLFLLAACTNPDACYAGGRAWFHAGSGRDGC